MKQKEEDFDPIELMKRKFRILCRFRAVGRLVMDNACWMTEEHLLRRMTERVRRSVVLTLKKITVKKQILSLDDKIILYKPVEWRDDHTKNYLNRLLGGLKFYRSYPKNTRRKLTGVTRFISYGAHRVLLKQGHKPKAMYFIVDGTVQKRDDKGLIESVLMSGDVIALEELYYEEPHTFTYTSLTPIQLLYVEKSHFQRVLSVTLQRHWDEVRHAMSLFNYFSNYTEKTIRQACLVAKVKNFKPKELIYGDGVGDEGFVYFIYSGTCQIIDSLLIEAVQSEGKVRYYLFEQEKMSTDKIMPTLSSEEFIPDNVRNQESRILTNYYIDELRNLKTSAHFSEFSNKASQSTWSKTDSNVNSSPRQPPRLNCYSMLPQNVKLVFMQVSILNEGGCFNLGESYDDRRVVSVNNVKCLLLPRVWLVDNNLLGFWAKIKWYLERHIPSRDDMFKQYMISQEWKKYKDDIFNDLLRTKKAKNVTTSHDVPLTVRIDGNYHCPKSKL